MGADRGHSLVIAKGGLREKDTVRQKIDDRGKIIVREVIFRQGDGISK